MYQHGGDDGLRVAVTGARAFAEPVLAVDEGQVRRKLTGAHSVEEGKREAFSDRRRATLTYTARN